MEACPVLFICLGLKIIRPPPHVCEIYLSWLLFHFAFSLQKHITLIGSEGKLGPMALSGPGVHYKPSAEDTFTLRGENIGDITQVVVKNDGVDRNDAWLLETLLITVKHGGKSVDTYKCACHQWLRYAVTWIDRRGWVGGYSIPV